MNINDYQTIVEVIRNIKSQLGKIEKMLEEKKVDFEENKIKE